MQSARTFLPYFSGVVLGLVYALVAYGVFLADLPGSSVGVMSVAFLMVMPAAIGALSVMVAPPERRGSVWYLLAAPWISCLLLGFVVLVFSWDVILCVVMALPLFLPLATVGAVLAFVIIRSVAPGPGHRHPMLLVALVPFLVAPIEAQIRAPDSFHVVHNAVDVAASPEQVWRQIVRVPAIQASEQRFSPTHLIGLPRPVEATLSHEGIGAVRHASFEGGLVFVETVTEWRERQAIGFSIVRDRGSEPPRPFGAIGGPYFDTLDGRYEIEPLGDGTVRLHLWSTHRLTTRFNGYAGLWTEAIMSELQRYILAIVKARAEASER